MGIPFGRYELIRKIAAGGMGQVLLARKGSEGFEKLVVIKRILPHLVEDEEFFTMFIDEAKITMRLDHPNIARISEFGVENGVHFIEMEYVAGEDVRRMEKRAKQLEMEVPLGVILRIFADAAAGLDFAHKAKDSKGTPLGLVHRDVSPQNILIGFDGAVKLIDFGVAKAMGRGQHTATGILKGKFPYMSPEQAEGLDLDARSDVFALGIVLWEQLTGKRLFKGDNDLMTQRLVKACQVPPPSTVNPQVPKQLDTVVLRALAKDPANRYPDAAAFRMALEDFALKHSIPASSAHLSEFMSTLYAERIAREQDPKALEEDSGLTDLDAVGISTGAAGTRADKGQPPAPQHNTQAVQPGSSKTPLFAGLGVLALLGIGAAVYFTRTPPPAPVVALPPPPGGVVVKPPEVKPPVEPVVEWLTVSVQSDPASAEVELGGEKKGLTPLELKLDKSKLPTLLKLTHDGYEPYQATLSSASEPIVNVPLKKKAVVHVGGTAPPPEIKRNR